MEKGKRVRVLEDNPYFSIKQMEEGTIENIVQGETRKILIVHMDGDLKCNKYAFFEEHLEVING